MQAYKSRSGKPRMKGWVSTRIGVPLALILALILTGIVAQPAPVAVQAAVNLVNAEFATVWDYGVPGDAFTNTTVNGRMWWKASMWNTQDATAQQVTGLELSLNSGLALDKFAPPPPTTIAPPNYQWSFGDIPEGDGRIGHVEFQDPAAAPMISYIPGFDVSRSADVTVFSAPGVQTLTITVTPREAGTHLDINVWAREDDLVNPVITSPSSGEGIRLSPDGHFLGITTSGLPLNTPWTVVVTIQVTPKVSKVQYIPSVVVAKWDQPLASGAASASSVSYAVDAMGTWTWSAVGSYDWQWEEAIIRTVYLETLSRDITNEVWTDFGAQWVYQVSGDTFTNGAVTGRREWGTNIQNQLLETGGSVANATLTLASNLAFDLVSPPGLILMGPPTYQWFFGDVPVGAEVNGEVAFSTPDPFPVTFTPGFDASRSADVTEFTAPGTQTLTITVTPREPMPVFRIEVFAEEDDLVNAVITSPTSGEDIAAGLEIGLSPDGHYLGIWQNDPIIGTQYIYAITIEVTPKVPAPVQFLPAFDVAQAGPPLASGTVTGSSLSRTVPGMGTWTWSAVGSYTWRWNEFLSLDVHWPGESREIINEVSVDFGAGWVYQVSGDTFTNGAVTGRGEWGTNIQNRLLETGAPVANATLTLDSTLAFDSVWPDPILMGPPTYQWSFGDVPVGVEVNGEVAFSTPDPFPVTFTPGFDASRSADVTEFTAPGTQTLTITVTPREPMLAFRIAVFAWEDDLVNAVITSPTSGEGIADVLEIGLSPDGHSLLILNHNPVVGTQYTYTVTIQVTPKVPAPVQFFPDIRVEQNRPPLASGTVTGSSLSRTVPGMGTWTWSAVGNYTWSWHEFLSPAIHWPGESREITNELRTDFGALWVYQVSGDNFTNGEVTGSRTWQAEVENRLYETGGAVTGLGLSLDSTLAFDSVWPDPILMGPPTYQWSFGDVPVGVEVNGEVGFSTPDPFPVTFTPGFDASRTVDVNEFSAPGTQTLTISVTPREPIPAFRIAVFAGEDDLVNAVITSPTSGEGIAAGLEIDLSPDGRALHMLNHDPVVGTQYTYAITIEVTPKVPAPVQFFPDIRVEQAGPPLASGTVTGSSLSRTVPGMGTWTWSAVGSYTWRWKEFLSLAIRWEGRSAINQVQGQFTTFWDYTPPGDAFSDSQVTGGTWWLASMQNGTGQPVASLELTLDSALALDAAWPGPDPILMGPPTYQWSFGDLPPGSEAAAAVQPTSPDAALVTFAPGFDVSRSADKTVFTALDTQTLTITVTPRQAMEGFFTIVFAEENDLVNPIITSFTGGEGGEISPDGRQLFMGAAGGIGTPVTFTVTIQVTPKVPTVEFMPAVWVITPGEFLGKGTASGSSVSSTVNTLGTWTWSAVGNYSWGWQAFVLRAVTFPAYSHNTPTGTNVEVAVDGNTVTFGQVTTSGNTKVTTTSTGPAIPSLFKLGTPPTYFDFTTTAVYSPPVTLCMDYSAIRFGNEGQLKLWQWSGTGWLDITISLDTQNDIICGQGSTLSIFAIVEPNLPPVAQASVDVYLAPVGSVFAFDGSASYDPDGTIVSYDWSFDDSSSGSGVSVTHSYAAAGLYDVVLTVTDDLGAQGSDTVLVVVYDPAAGFATGGGWFVPGGPTSDLGDRLPGLDNTSPANFGFVVKYKPGATTPDGQLEFQYRQGDFNLHSSGMDWLVIVNNNWAKFHGSATIKGLEGLFPFRVDARDGDFSGGNQPDRFIIKVWAPGADPDTDDPIYKASGDLQGGNIIIHTK